MFSVIIPLYNKHSTVRRAISSVLTQSVQDFEIVVVDDGSTDNSAQLVLDYVDPRIRLVQKENGGDGSSRNLGIRHAAGDMLAFLDADDQWLPDFLQRILDLARDFPAADFFGLGCVRVAEDGKREYQNCVPRAPWRGYLSYFKAAARGSSPLTSSSVVIKRSLQERVGLFNENWHYHGIDLEFWCRLQLDGTLAFDSKVSAEYYVGLPNNSMKISARGSKDVVVSYSTQLVLAHLAQGRIRPDLLEDALIYVEERFLAAVHGYLYQRNPKQARVLLRLGPARHLILKRLVFEVLARLPAWLLSFLLSSWSRRRELFVIRKQA